MSLRPPLRAAIAPSLVLSLTLSLPLAAQERVPGGRLLSFGISTGIDASDNPDLDDDERAEIEASTGLSLGLLTATPTQRFELGTDFGLAARAGGDPEADSVTVTDPNGSFLYSRASRASEFIVAGEVESEELSTRNPLELATDDLVDLEDEEELQELIAANEVSDDARRLTFDVEASLETRRNAPFGVAYGLGLSGVRYSAAPDAFEEETQLSGGLGFRFTLTEITEATVDLTATTGLGEEDDDRVAVDFDIGQNRRIGNLGASLRLVDENGDLRTSLLATGAFERPTLVLNGEIGGTRAGGGELALVGAAGLVHQLSRTQSLRVDLRRQVTQIDDLDAAGADRERVVTTLQGGYDYDITRLWRLGLDARYTRAAVVGDVEELDTYGEIGAALGRPLTEDWTFNVGVRHRFETNSDGSDASSNTISVSLNRTVRIPY